MRPYLSVPAAGRIHQPATASPPPRTRINNAKAAEPMLSRGQQCMPGYSRLAIGPAQGCVSSGSRADWIGTSGQCLAGIVFGLNGNFSARIFS